MPRAFRERHDDPDVRLLIDKHEEALSPLRFFAEADVDCVEFDGDHAAAVTFSEAMSSTETMNCESVICFAFAACCQRARRRSSTRNSKSVSWSAGSGSSIRSIMLS